MTGTPQTLTDLGNIFAMDLTGIDKQGRTVGNTSAAGATLYGGSGVPSSGLGANGDVYFRTDTPATLAQRIYIKSAGSWINALA